MQWVLEYSKHIVKYTCGDLEAGHADIRICAGLLVSTFPVLAEEGRFVPAKGGQHGGLAWVAGGHNSFFGWGKAGRGG